jgi:hypothetical protein
MEQTNETGLNYTDVTTTTTEAKPNLTGQNFYNMRPAEQINQAIAELPRAENKDIVTIEGEKVQRFNAVKVTDSKGNSEIVAVPHKSYQVIQHAQAFRPIIEGMTTAGIHDFKFVMKATHRKAEMQIYATGTGYDSVSLGFSVLNSFDGSKALSYGFRIFGEQKTIELVGYRQVCSNGMKIRVPLENAEFVRPEIKSKVMELFSQYAKILHTRNAVAKIESMQYVTEAISLLRQPIELYIRKAQNWKIENNFQLMQLIKAHIGKRFASKVIEQMTTESQDLWGLYNAMTYVASHDSKLKPSARDSLIDKASIMLEKELQH